MKKLYISEKTPKSINSILQAMGFSLVLLPCDCSLPEPVSSHADMLIFENVVQKDYYSRHRELFFGCDPILAEEKFGNEYPHDVLLNAFVWHDTLFGRLVSLSATIKSLYPKQINLRQGYAKCSTLLFGDNAITADKNIAAALSDQGCNVLLIRPGHISLPGYDYGFIGGASFTYENNIIFFGNIEKLPDYIKIKDFIADTGYKAVYDKTIPLTDLGGAILMNF